MASEHGVPVVARGSGTGLAGAAVPVADGILLAFDRMKRILEVDTENQVAVVEPGVTLEQLNGELAPLAHLPRLARRAERFARRQRGDQRRRDVCRRYGVTCHHVLGLEAALADGTVLRTGGKFVKSSSGYDLTHCSSAPKERGRHHRGDRQAPASLHGDVHRPGPFRHPLGGGRRGPTHCPERHQPVDLEYVDILVMGGITQAAGLDLGVPEEIKARTLAYLIVVLEGMDADRVDEDVEQLAELSAELGALDVYVLPSTSGAQLIAARERAFFVGKAAGCDDLIDAVIPRADIPDYLAGWPRWRTNTGCSSRVRPHRRRQRPYHGLPARRRATP